MSIARGIAICVGLCGVAFASAQDQPKRKQQGRPGEVITKPDLSLRVKSNLAVGDVAPEFKLPRVGAAGELSLADYQGQKPVVLIFGTFSCPPYRRNVVDFPDLYEQYRNRAEFVQVYIREAHPDSVLFVREGDKEVLQKVEQSDSVEARVHNAEVCRATLKLPFPAVVDRDDNAVSHAYGGWPNRLVIVDKDGKVAWLSDPKPSAFKATDVSKWLKEYVGPPMEKPAAP